MHLVVGIFSICIVPLLLARAASSGATRFLDEAADPVELTLVQDAIGSGAVCLDGSLPGYHLDRGSGPGLDKWIVHLQGGAWCADQTSCAERSQTALGSSNFMNSTIFQGILSSSPSENPFFFSWNRVLVRYCDGGSFSGNVELPALGHIPATRKSQLLYYRGQRIWQAVMADLFVRGMASATQAILSGDSAGGLAALIHCNAFKDQFPKNTDVKCLSDGGVFLDIADVQGNFLFQYYFRKVVMLQNISYALPKGCTSQRDPGQCFFPEYFLEEINPPTFILQSAYDIYQIRNELVPPSEDPSGNWTLCEQSPSKCSPDQLKILQDLRRHLLTALSPLQTFKSWGLFVVSCFVHTQSVRNDFWTGPTRVQNTSMIEAIGLWAFGGGATSKFIDCPYPCNPTCPR